MRLLTLMPKLASLQDPVLQARLQERLANKTMPAGALGQIARLGLQLGLIQGTDRPQITNTAIILFAADHGVANRGVSAFPKAVTAQMVLNFLNGGAAINVFARSNKIQLYIVDAGVDYEFVAHPKLIAAKIGPGTRDFSGGPAMTDAQCEQAIERGMNIVDTLAAQTQWQALGFGEMGIGNSSSAAALTARMLNQPIEACVGRGTGVDDTGLAHKTAVLRQALALHSGATTALDLLARLGGFEIAMMVGAMLAAARRRMAIVIDGFIVTSALLVAQQLRPAVREYCVFAHRSSEAGHTLALQALGAEPLLDLGLRLGEGSGAALAMPLLQNAAAMLSDMASFDSAGVSRA